MKPVTAAAKSAKPAAPAAELALPVILREAGHNPVPAHICRVNTGFFLVSSPRAIEPKQRLQVVLAGRPIDTQVVYCHPHEDEFQVGAQMVQDADLPLRAEPRIPVDMPAELTVAGMAGPIPARLANISASGLGLNIDRQIGTGEMACVKLDIGFAFGEIRHCSRTPNGFRAGMKLDEFISVSDEMRAAETRMPAPEKPSAFARFFGRKN